MPASSLDAIVSKLILPWMHPNSTQIYDLICKLVQWSIQRCP